ncbi:uncharacterized protein CCR75_000103 [Bremia lactucae]|uniref:RNA helicase n=1 Tax=Bremia lactucae TaxID=4779 RepID=A0A976IHR9_BRELC|nr:hypothetical protein CCR75_000103 [Bremia lactucae]
MCLAVRSSFHRSRLFPRLSALISLNSPRRYFAARSFLDLGVDARIVAGLEKMRITMPTDIQSNTIQTVLAGHDVLCTAQTGTGKTLAYLIPVVEQILRRESAKISEQESENSALVVMGRPSALVLLPSRELALQVASVAKQLSHLAKFASCSITSGERKSIQQRNTSRRLDLIIGTPGRLAKCISKKDFFLSRIDTVVVDEADTLFDAKMGFRKEMDAILEPILASVAKRKQSLQIILAAATICSPIDQVLKKKFGNLRSVSDGKIHKTPTSIKEEFVRVSPGNKHSALRETLSLHMRHATKCIIFCRNALTVRSTEHMLREHGFQNMACLHGDMPPARRLEAIQAFKGDASVNILVCTDLAARGLDVMSVHHVIMFDFPKSAVNYVHRAGRTGRAKEKGLVTSLVTKHDLTLAMSIENSKRSKSTIKELREDASANYLTAQSSQHPTSAVRVREKQSPALSQCFNRGTKKMRNHKIRSSRLFR